MFKADAKKMRTNRRRDFHPLRRQIAVLFIGLLFLSILVITIINALFLEQYYISEKTDVLLEAITVLESLDISEEDENLGREEIPDAIRNASSQNNLSWVIIGRDGHEIVHVGNNESMLKERLFGYAYNLDFQKNKAEILKETDSYVIQQVNDRFV